jgi:hypothetical protein
MHRKYGPDGLVCLSVSVDEPEEEGQLEPLKKRVLDFLTRQKADFANYLLDEDAGVWQNRWKFKAPPGVLVFGPDGTVARKFDNDDPDHEFTYDDVEPVVRKLLAGGR